MSEPDSSITDLEQAAVAECCPQLVAALDAKLFQALGDENRLMLLCRLAASREMQTVTELASCCGVHISGVSRHLAQLRDAGVIEAQKEGRVVRYRLNRELLAKTLRAIADGLDPAAQ
jgi:DNA-binding transcriptional ArsR family regulator